MARLLSSASLGFETTQAYRCEGADAVISSVSPPAYFGAEDSAATELSATVICNTHQDFNFRYAANDRLPFFQRLLPERCPGIVSNPHSDLTPSSSSIFPGSVVGSLQLYLTQTYAVAFPWIADW